MAPPITLPSPACVDYGFPQNLYMSGCENEEPLQILEFSQAAVSFATPAQKAPETPCIPAALFTQRDRLDAPSAPRVILCREAPVSTVPEATTPSK